MESCRGNRRKLPAPVNKTALSRVYEVREAGMKPILIALLLVSALAYYTDSGPVSSDAVKDGAGSVQSTAAPARQSGQGGGVAATGAAAAYAR